MSFYESIISVSKKKPKEELWLLSYADLVTNLMAIFIMMLAISKVDYQKFDNISSKITQRNNENSLDELQKKLNAEIKAFKLEDKITTELGITGLNVEFLSGVLFNSASADLSDKAWDSAKAIVEILSKTDKKYLINFEGHTDDVPMKKNTKYRDNWDLSAARGTSLLEKMKQLGVEENRMGVAGYAHTRPKIIIENKKDKELEEARTANRRVVIRVYQ